MQDALQGPQTQSYQRAAALREGGEAGRRPEAAPRLTSRAERSLRANRSLVSSPRIISTAPIQNPLLLLAQSRDGPSSKPTSQPDPSVLPEWLCTPSAGLAYQWVCACRTDKVISFYTHVELFSTHGSPLPSKVSSLSLGPPLSDGVGFRHLSDLPQPLLFQTAA